MAEPVSRDVWSSFQHDPRDPANAPLRAADVDRGVVQQVLTEAFADGRLDREEYDERATAALQARTLGELPPLVADLVPDRPLLPAASPLAAATSTDLAQRAQEKWVSERREAVFSFLGSVLLFGALFLFIEVPWVLIVPLLAGLRMLRTLTSGDEIRAEEVRRLEKKRAKELRARDEQQPES
ncbi:DUF1707 SHOCT-like domain-containing protein [Nocardioides anomalus]|uniref:DUF1707 SHOCT-like domain-containing protein n=1 Tax=Nocardioides anomalus TaxID=2712223 RepID=UPI001E646706|nr:DUF1707 domain-containing protein [Nocardioides anomalus]